MSKFLHKDDNNKDDAMATAIPRIFSEKAEMKREKVGNLVQWQ